MMMRDEDDISMMLWSFHVVWDVRDRAVLHAILSALAFAIISWFYPGPGPTAPAVLAG